MKHFTQATANGLHTPPCGSSHGNLSSFRFRNSLLMPLLLLFLLIVGNSALWAAFTPGTTYYVDFRTVDFYKEGAVLLVNFYDGDSYKGDINRATVTQTSFPNIYSFTIPDITTDNFKIVRLNPNNLSQRWNQTVKMYQNAAGSNNCINLTSWPSGDVPCSWTTYTPEFQGGEVFYMKQNTICTDGNSHDFLKYGRCDFNLYDEGGTFLNKALSAQVIPGTDPVMLKFVVPAEYAGTVWGKVKVKQLGTGGNNETNKGDIPKDGKNYLINGNTMEWGTYFETVTYTGNEYIFLSKQQQHTDGNTFDFTAAGAHIFVYFWNSETNANAWSDEAFMWDSGDNVLGAKVPAGTWTNCKVVRKNSNDSGKNWNNVWNQSHDQTIEAGQNYLRTGESSVWAVYTPPFYLTGSSVLCGADWGYTGNGTVNNGTVTRENIPAGTYQFKLNPTKNYNGWEHQINYTHVASTGSNVTLSSPSDNQIQFTLSEASDVTIAYDGNGVTVNATPYAPPAVTRTVTIHPNGGTAVSPLSVGEGQTISSISSTYGNGTAKWYKDEELTQEFILGTSTVTEDMNLYAKWGVSGNYYIVGCLQTASDGGDSGNWTNTLSRLMTYESGTSGKCSFTFVAPSGKYPFEIIKNQSWSEKINEGVYDGMFDNSISDVTISATGGHLMFELASPKKVTVSYNGKVSVKVEDYSFDNSKTWRIKTSWDTGEGEWHYNTVMTNNGTTNATAILRNVSGTRSFIISTKTNDNDAQAVIGNETFNALYVDMTSPSTGLTWNTTSARRDGSDNFNSTTPQSDGHYWRNCKFTLAEQSDIRISFDGGKIRCDILPKYTVTFNSNGGSEVSSQTMFEGRTASEPADPTRDGYEFDSWRISSVEGAVYNFESPVTANITLVAKWNQVIKHTVTFNSNGGSAVASQSVFEGAQASEPSAPTKAGYEFVKWQLSGADYDFSSAVTGNITLDAVWAYKAVSSVALNESEHTTWVGNSNFVLTLTKNPSDLITKSVVWSSDNTSAASVSNGTVHAEGVGTATITCTVTDMFDNVRTATCDVTVAPCQMTTDALYSMTVTGYNSSTGDNATLTGLWNQSSDNTEPATFRIVKLKLSNNYYIYDDNGTVKMSTDASLAAAQWYEIPTSENFSPDWTGSSFALYEFKNVSTGKYMRRGAGRYGDNGDWYYYTTLADNRETDGNIYKFFYDNTLNTHLVCREGVNSTLRQSYAIHNNNLNWAAGYSAHCATPMVVCGYTNDPEHNAYTWLHETVVVDPSYANPNYKLSLMNSSYYRMKADATVQANLANGLAYGSVITVRLYADAATSVKLQTAAGDDVETINLNADAAREYTYTVAYGSELVGATAFIIKAADNHAGIASIEVSRMHAVSPADPALTWDADLSGGVEQSALAGTFQHVASSALSDGAVHYVSSNPAVATVAADGTVTPIMAGNTTITATIEQRECYAEASIAYGITLTEPTLAELIAADAGAGITLTHDYAENIVVNKAVTINGGGHSIGNLKVENEGDLTLSSALTVADFTICTNAGNSEHQAASGQVRNASYLNATGNVYFLYTVDPSGHVQYGWYDFTVPFRVDVMTGIAGIDENSVLKEDFVNERDYAIMEHLGEKQANGEYSYKKFRGIMQPNKLYSITLDNDYNYNTIRFQKTSDGALVASNEVPLNTYASTVDDKHANWNGVGNGTLHHADAGLSVKYVQVYQSGDKTFKPYDKNDISLVVGTAFMVQQAGGTMTLNQASHGELRAPARQSDDQRPAISIQIAREGKPFSDQLFITANEDAQPTYTPSVDVAKAGNIGNVNVPQIWTNAYNSKLCAHEAQLIDGEAQYTLSLYAPANGSYTLTSTSIPAGTTLYLTQNDHIIWDMSENYTFDLNKGTTTEYGLLLVQSHKIPTGIENGEWTNDEGRKVLHNGILYILHNGKVFNAQGAMMK